MRNKPLFIAALAATISTASLSTPASANDPVLGALIGAGIGAAIGHGVNGRDGAWVGGALGAVAGASIAASSRGYYDDGYYGGPSVAYGEPAPVYYGAPYYQPAPVYYAPAVRVYSGPADVPAYRSHHATYGRDYARGRGNWR